MKTEPGLSTPNETICQRATQDLQYGFDDPYCTSCWEENESDAYIDRDDCYSENAIHYSDFPIKIEVK